MNSNSSRSDEKGHNNSFPNPGGYWEQITLPHPSIREPERRQRIRLLSNLLITLFLAAFAAVIVDWLAKGVAFNTLWILTNAVIFAIAYRLSRTIHYKIAAVLTVIAIWVSILYAANLNQMPENLNFLMLVALFSSLFLSPRPTILVSAAAVVTILLFPIFAPAFSIRDILEEAFLVALTGAISTVAASVQLGDMRYIEQQTRELSAHVKKLVQGREALQRSETRLSNILDHATEAIISIDESQNIILFNKAAERIFGYQISEVLGQQLDTLLPRRSVASHQKFVETFGMKSQTGGLIGGRREVSGRRKDGKEFPALVGISKLVENNQVIFTAVLSDITVQKESEKEIFSLSKFPDENPSPILRVTEDGRILYANKASVSLLKTWKREVGQNLPEEWHGYIRQAFESDRIIEVEIESFDKVFACVLSPIQSTGYINLYCLDITGRKQAEETLRRSEEQYHTLFDRIPTALYRTSPQGQILDANPALVELLGYPDYETLSKVNVGEIYLEPEERDRRNRIRLQEGTVQVMEIGLRRFDGQAISVRDTSRAVKVADGNIGYFEGSLEDITERKRAEEALAASHQRFESLIKHAPDGIALLGVDGKLRQVTPSTEQILGYTLEEAQGQDPASLTHPDDLPDLMVLLNDLVQNPGKVVKTQYRFSHKDGSWRWLDSTISNLIPEPSVGAIVFNNRDITESKRVEESLLKSQETYRNLFENNPHPMWVYDKETLAFLMVNDAAVEHYGYTRDEFLKMSVRDIRPKEDLPMLSGNLAQESLPLEKSSGWRHLKRDGSIIDVEITSHTILFEGRPARLVLANDITERKQFEDELRALNAELEQRVAIRTEQLSHTNVELKHASSAKDEFLANMSHELRTPLNSILGLSESLLEQTRDPLTDRQQRSLQIIESSGRHLLSLINDILDLSKIEAGKFDYYPEIIGVKETCHSSLAFVKSQALKKSIDVFHENAGDASQLFADPRRLKQILVNLLTNAVKFTPEGGRMTLGVYVDEEQDLIQFSVRDSGIGIAQEDLKRLFQPFVQVDSRLNRQFEGTGLGLALVQKLTDLHGGSVHVESEVGKGSCFTVSLPWGKEMLRKPTTVQSAVASHSILGLDHVGWVSPPSDNKVILLAEDNMANILTIGEYLENHGHRVVNAHDGLQAIKMAEDVNPDIVLMDIQMPVMDGVEATRRLRADPRFASTPIIALTALAMSGDRERCLEAGANEYMTKPVSLKNLLHIVNEMLDPNNAQ